MNEVYETGLETVQAKQIKVLEAKIDKLKALLLLTDPVMSKTTIGKTQVTQWGEFCREYPDEGQWLP